VEGLQIIAPKLDSYILPFTILVLLVLFIVQAKGTGKVGRMFSPVMVFWFATLAVLGLSILSRLLMCCWPSILLWVNMLFELGWKGFAIMGAVVLAITGAEALYADMGILA